MPTTLAETFGFLFGTGSLFSEDIREMFGKKFTKVEKVIPDEGGIGKLEVEFTEGNNDSKGEFVPSFVSLMLLT